MKHKACTFNCVLRFLMKYLPLFYYNFLNTNLIFVQSCTHVQSYPIPRYYKFWVTGTFPNETNGCHILRMVCRMFHIRLVTVTFIWGASPKFWVLNFG